MTLPGGPLSLEIAVTDPGPESLGLAVDWVRIVGAGWRVPASFPYPWLLAGGVFVLCIVVGFDFRLSLVAGGALALAQALWAALDPFGLMHVSAHLVLPALFFSALTAVLLTRRQSGRWVVLVFLAGYLLKGAGLFYPSYFYPDVRNHRRYVFAFADAAGSLAERGVAAQIQVSTAYPRTIAGKVYAMPYSPIYFVPFTWLPREPHRVEEALKHVSLAAAAFEVVVVYVLAGLLFSEGTGVLAALLCAFLPPMYSRLLLAMYPTIAGHLLDTLTIAGAAWLVLRPESTRRLAVFAGLTLTSLFAYIASLFNLSSFAAFLAILERRRAWRLFAVALLSAVLTVALLYASFARSFVGEIAPALLQGDGTRKSGGLFEGIAAALARIPLFYGWGTPALAAAGLVLARRRAPARSFHVVAAYALAFSSLVLLRSLPGGLFKDLKEILFVGPLFALTAGSSLEALAERGRSERIAAIIVGLTLMAFGMAKYRDYLSATTSLVGIS